MQKKTSLKFFITLIMVLALLAGCVGPQPPAAPADSGEAAESADAEESENADAEAADEPELPQLAAEIPPLAAEAEGIEYTEVPELAFEGEITVYAQGYTPVEPTSNAPNPPRYLNRIVAEYEKLHPNIQIELLPPLAPGSDYITWVRTQAAGAQLPDIV